MTDKHYAAMSFCFKNEIYIYPKVAKGGYTIEIQDKNKYLVSPVVYTKKEMEYKIWELYLYFYDKFIE